MRKRSEAKRRPFEDPPFESCPVVIDDKGEALNCIECGEMQRLTHGGASCRNGHGGAEGLTAKEYRRQKGLDASDREPPPLFQTAHGKPEAKLASGYAAIVERIFVETPEKDYAHLEEDLTIKGEVTYSALMKQLNQAEDNARLAHRLFSAAKVERERYEIEATAVLAGMRENATRILQREKDEGHRNKAITDADVTAAMSQHYPDEWKAQTMDRVKVKVMVDHLEKLSDLWSSRCRSLATMLSSLRK
jgi:hypothetical protein